MQRDLLLLGEMIQAAERAHHLADGATLNQLQDDRMRTESLLWNFTVLGEATTQLSSELKDRFPRIPWQQPARLRNRILHTTATDQLPTFARAQAHPLRRERVSLATPAELTRRQGVRWGALARDLKAASREVVTRDG